MRRNLKAYFGNDSGQVAMIFALAALPLLTLTSAAIDYSQLTNERNAISSALDAAVLAAANNNAISVGEKATFAETHFRANYASDIKLDITSSVTPSRVRLAVSGELQLKFGNMVGIENPLVVEASAASLATESTICVLALSEDADDSISFNRDIEFLAAGCSVHSNSMSTMAIVAEQNVYSPTASSFCAVGGILGDVVPHSKGECSRVQDPYSETPLADEGPCQTVITDALDEYEAASEEFEQSILPNLSGLTRPPFGQVMDHLIEIDYASMSSESVTNNRARSSLRRGDHPNVIQQAARLDAADLYHLISLYDEYGSDTIDCLNNPIPSCSSFNNPYENSASDEVPLRHILEGVFEFSYGELPEILNPPSIVSEGLVELINGQLYTRNNEDGEHVPLSGNLTGDNMLLSPGTYCGGLSVDGLRVQFLPGDYIFKDGPLTFLNQSVARADEVTFGFKGLGATLNIESGSALTIRSATTGPRQGLAFMHMVDPDLPGNRAAMTGVNRIASGGRVSMSGTAYFPNQELRISGEDSRLGANSPAVGLIADTISFQGERGASVEIGVDHRTAGIPPIQPRVDDGVRLIE